MSLPALLLLSVGILAAWYLIHGPTSGSPPSRPPRAPAAGGRASGNPEPSPALAGLEIPALAREAMTILPGVHLLGRTFPNAAYAVETSEGLALVDTCQEGSAGPILDQMDALGLDPARLRMILLTHAHGDHSMGAARLAELTGAAVYAGREAAAILRAGGPEEAIYSVFQMRRDLHRTEVDVALDGGEEIRLGEAVFRALAAPGHSPGGVCYLLELRGMRILFTGDVIMSLSNEGPLTGTGVYSTALAPRFGGDAKAFESTLRMLLALPPPDLVLPGHPGVDLEPQDPRVPAWWWKELLEDGIAKLRRTRDRLATDGTDFLDRNPRELLPGLYSLGQYGGTACYALRGAKGELILVNAPGDAECPARLREALRAAGAGSRLPAAVLLTSSWKHATGGLRSLLLESPCVVYAPAEGLEEVRARCPVGADLRPAESLPGASGIEVSVLPVRGAASPSVSYLFRREGKSILATGEIPDPVTIEPEDGAGRWSGRRPSDPGAVLSSLAPFRTLAPDLWIPLRPLMDQNANLYDSDWRKVLEHTRIRLEDALR